MGEMCISSKFEGKKIIKCKLDKSCGKLSQMHRFQLRIGLWDQEVGQTCIIPKKKAR